QYVARFAAKRNQPRQQISATLIGTSGRKADKSACVPCFSVDSRNENLPEKCIHQNCASRPGRHAARDFCYASAACLPLKIRKDASKRPPQGHTRCNRWLRETFAGSIPLLWDCYLQ